MNIFQLVTTFVQSYFYDKNCVELPYKTMENIFRDWKG